MRTLAFKQDQRPLFNMLHVSIYKCPADFSREEIRILAKVQDIFESVSEDVTVDGATERTIVRDVTFRMEEREWEILQKAFKLTPWKASVAKKIVATEDFLEAIKEEKP